MRFFNSIIVMSITATFLPASYSAGAEPGACDAFARTVLQTQEITSSLSKYAQERAVPKLNSMAMKFMPIQIGMSGEAILPSGYEPDENGFVTLPIQIPTQDVEKLGMKGPYMVPAQWR